MTAVTLRNFHAIRERNGRVGTQPVLRPLANGPLSDIRRPSQVVRQDRDRLKPLSGTGGSQHVNTALPTAVPGFAPRVHTVSARRHNKTVTS